MSDPEAPSDEPQAVDLEEFVVILPEEMEGGDYCLQNGPRPTLFLAKDLSQKQVPLGQAALSQVSSALDSVDPAKLLRRLSNEAETDQQHCIKQKRQRLRSLSSFGSSFGSFDILDAEDLNHPGSETIQLRPITRENSAEDYILLLNPHSSEGDSLKHYSKHHPSSILKLSSPLLNQVSRDPSSPPVSMATTTAANGSHLQVIEESSHTESPIQSSTACYTSIPPFFQPMSTASAALSTASSTTSQPASCKATPSSASHTSDAEYGDGLSQLETTLSHSAIGSAPHVAEMDGPHLQTSSLDTSEEEIERDKTITPSKTQVDNSPVMDSRNLGAKSGSSGELVERVQHPPIAWHMSDPGCSDNSYSRFKVRHGSDPGTTKMYLKRKNLCDIARAFSEPNPNDVVTSDLLTEIRNDVSPKSEPSSLHHLRPHVESDSCSDSAIAPSEADIKACIVANCKDFLNYSNWKLILPCLMAKDLLDSDICEILMSNSRTNLDKGLTFYLSVLPSKGKTAYSRFYQCILEEEEHSGHRTLLELMDNFKKT